jgi:hypothetical protein
MNIRLLHSTKKIFCKSRNFALKINNLLFRWKLPSQLSTFYLKEKRPVHAKIPFNIHTDYLLSTSNKERIIEYIQALLPNSIQETIVDANSVCDHIFSLFGEKYSFGPCINWHKDLVSGFEWPLNFYSDIAIINLADTTDIKFPWQLNGFYHAFPLAKAYWFTEDEKYAEEFVWQVHSWIESNPPNKGINWNCSMIVAIRVINLIWAYSFFIESKSLSEKFHNLFVSLIFAHGRHIFGNLENTSLINGNHYLCNLIGLIYVSSIFPFFKHSNRWGRFALQEIIKEINEQVYDDGTNFEASIPYHGFVTEIFLHASLLLIMRHRDLQVNDTISNYKSIAKEIFGTNYTTKLEKMCEFILCYTKSDGLAPQIGDNDDGRLIKLGTYENKPNDHRCLLAIAGELFDRDDFRIAGFESYEDAVWLFGGNVQPQKTELTLDSVGYTDSGIYIMRKDKDYLIVRCGKLGTGGKGSHTHNDNLSFELCSNNITYIVDPGTFTYSRDVNSRNLFRSTSYHNTLVIDGEEQNTFSKKDIFMLHKNSKVGAINWNHNEYEDYFVGNIIQYLRDGTEVIHKREIHFNKVQRTWHIKDVILGDGLHNLVWHFHANHNVSILNNEKIFSFKKKKCPILNMIICEMQPDSCEVVKGWYSPSYGIKMEADVLRIHISRQLPYETSFTFYMT